MTSLRSTISLHPTHLTLHYPSHTHTLTHARLRESCQCPQCVDPSTRQRKFSFRDIPDDPPTININDNLDVTFSPSHSYSFTPTYLRSLFTRPSFPRHHWVTPAQLGNPRVFTDMLTELQSRGIVILKASLDEITSDLPIRNTFYGTTWDVKSVKQSKNVAYTHQHLGLHMDLLYFSSPPRFQLLHCLRNRVQGGTSYFVDSFAAAEEFIRSDPDAHLLQTHPLTYTYDNDNHYLSCSHPILPRDFSLLSAVNWSPPFLGHRPELDPETDARFIAAVKRWESLVEEPSRRYEFRMEEGDSVIFDNRRVLHARTAYSGAAEGRWLRGCYLDGEVVWDALSTREARASASEE